MIQRSILRQSRTFSSNISRSFTTSPFKYYSQLPRISPLSRRHPRLAQRCYSTTPSSPSPITEGESSSAEDASSSEQQAEYLDPHRQEVEAKDREIIELKDKYLRSVAEFRNLQDRTKRDIQSAKDFAITRFAKDLIDSVDNLDRALSLVSPSSPSPSSPPSPPSSTTPSSSSSSPSSPPPPPSTTNTTAASDLLNLYNGLKMTEEILMQTLKKHGLERFDPSVQGEKFDPNLHEATFLTRVEGKEDGTAFHTQQKGFLLNGRVVRAAKVGVVKNS